MGKTVDTARVHKGNQHTTLKVLEFYSGIGGMHAALQRAAAAGNIPDFEVLAAFDINDVANRIYAHNFGDHVVRRVRSRMQGHGRPTMLIVVSAVHSC